MKCPHCAKACRSTVLETRSTADEILRRRLCGGCGKTYVSKEFTSPDLRISRKRTARQQAHENAARRIGIDTGPRGSGLHLKDVWR